MQTDRILRVKEICSTFGVCRATIYNWVRAGSFPPPISLGAHAIGWRESAVRNWLDGLKRPV
jgi:prophage regulatory protein